MTPFHILRLALLGACFASVSGNAATDGDRVKLKKLDAARAKVWTAWCKDVQRTDTLPALSHAPLADANHCAWAIPGMPREAVADKVRAIVGRVMKVAPEALNPDAALPRYLAADSAELLAIAVALEEEFSLTIPDDAIDNIDTLGHLVGYIQSRVEGDGVMDFFSGVKGQRPAAGYPFYLYLHGSGPRDQEWETGLKLALRFDDEPSMYAVPRIPHEGEFYRWWHRDRQTAWEHMLRRVLTDPDVDPARIYFFGISEGGYGSQRLASYYADYLAAAGPMAGGEPLRNAPVENLSHTPFSLITGENDRMFYRNILTPRTGHRLDSLEALYPDEYKHRVMLEEGHGHPVTYSLTTPWLSQYSREAQPCHFRWENFEMHGCKRNAFYNLEVIAESSAGRHDYEFSARDNVVRLDVREVEYIITEKDPYYGIELDNTRRYNPALHGKVRIYLSEQLVDLEQPVTLIVNGEERPQQQLSLSRETLRQSCRLFGDPMRLFPTYIEVEW